VKFAVVSSPFVLSHRDYTQDRLRCGSSGVEEGGLLREVLSIRGFLTMTVVFSPPVYAAELVVFAGFY